MSEWQCKGDDGEPDHDWKYVSDWGGDPNVIGGTFDCGYLECRVCGEEKHDHPNPSEYAYQAGDFD